MTPSSSRLMEDACHWRSDYAAGSGSMKGQCDRVGCSNRFLPAWSETPRTDQYTFPLGASDLTKLEGTVAITSTCGDELTAVSRPEPISARGVKIRKNYALKGRRADIGSFT